MRVRRAALLSAAAMATVVAGCGSDRPLVVVGEAARVRLFSQQPAMLTPWDDLLVVAPAAELAMTTAAWRVDPAGSAVDAPDGGIRVPGNTGGVVLEQPLGAVCAAARRIEATIHGVVAGEVRLRWGRPGDDGDIGWARMTRLAAPDDRYRVDVDADASWYRADTLRLEVRSEDGSTPTVAALSAFTKQLTDDARRTLAAAPLKLELATEARNAQAVWAGADYRQPLEVRGPGRLRLGYGVPAALRHPLDVAVALVTAAGEETIVARDRLEPGSGRAGRWLTASAGLTPFTGTVVELVVSVTAVTQGEPADPAADVLLLAEPEVVAPRPRSDGASNLLLVSIDALRADGLSLYGNPAPTSPRLDGWARRDGFVCRQTVAAAPWTLPAHMSMLTGLDAVRHGVNHDVGDARRLTAASPTAALVMLAEVLHDAGFATAAVTGGGYVDARYGFAQGFDSYASWPDRANDAGELAAGVDHVLGWIGERRDERFFMFLHSYAVHDPYRRWGSYLTRVAPGLGPVKGNVALQAAPLRVEDGFRQHNRFVLRTVHGRRPLGDSPADRALVRGLYHAGVAHADAELGRLLDGLAELGVRDRTVIVVTSDHGESLGEHGRCGHVDLTDDALLVPLIIAVPGGRGAGRELADQVRQVDLMPTVLDLLGIPAPPGLDGVSLVTAIDGGASPAPALAFSYSSAPNRGLGVRAAGELKYLLNTSAWRAIAGEEALYDLRLDPGEVLNVAPRDLRAAALRERARDYLARSAVGLRLAVVNPGPGTVVASLEGAMVGAVGTATLGALDQPWVSWVRAGEARIEAPPGAGYTLLFEKVMDRELRLFGEITVGGASIPLEWQVDVRELGDGRWLAFDGRRWREVATPPPPAAPSFRLSWRGPATVRGASPAADDAALREQLRALGYIDDE